MTLKKSCHGSKFTVTSIYYYLEIPGNVSAQTQEQLAKIFTFINKLGKKLNIYIFSLFFLLYAANKGQLPESSVTKVIYGIFGILRLIAGEFSYFLFITKISNIS